MRILILVIILSISCNSFAQKIIYSDPEKKDNAGIKFEIIGKLGSNVLIYKYISRNHLIVVYNNEMQVVSQNEISFIPEKIIDVDFISFPDHCYLMYQFQKKNIVYCAVADIASDGKSINTPVTLDSTAISFFASNKIYSVAYSEDKKNILIYKRNIKNNILDFSAISYDYQFKQKEKFEQKLITNEQKEFYSDMVVDNSGRFAFAKTSGRRVNNFADKLQFYIHSQGTDTLTSLSIDLQGKTINEPLIKIDNLNHTYLINSFYNDENNYNTEGLFTTSINMLTSKIKNIAFNAFYTHTNTATNKGGTPQYDNLIPINIVLKKSGGFMLIAEDFFAESLYSDNNWNRYDPYYPSVSTNDYYLYNPYYNSYRPYNNNYNSQSRTRYYYNDIVLADIDSSLQMNWNNSIHKKQYETDNDNHLSFSFMNTGKALHFLFIEQSEQKALISDNSLSPNGEIKKIPLIRNDEKNYEFMPRLAKQVGAKQIIMPFLYFNKLGFSLIEIQ